MKNLKKGTILKNVHPFFMQEVIVEKNTSRNTNIMEPSKFADVILTFSSPQPIGTLSIGFKGIKVRALLNKNTLEAKVFINDAYTKIQLSK